MRLISHTFSFSQHIIDISIPPKTAAESRMIPRLNEVIHSLNQFHLYIMFVTQKNSGRINLNGEVAVQ
jgi:hypothetical protein